MQQEIKCPNCGNLFEPTDAIREEVEKELRIKMQDWQKKKKEEFDALVINEKEQARVSAEENIRKTLSADYENQLKLLQQANADNEVSEQIRRQEAEKNIIKDNEQHLKIKELEKQLEDQKKLAEEMKRKAEQGSMQLQGEVQEQALEELLRTSFPFDVIEEVGKGVKGADCIQTVRNNLGNTCGKIIYESKRTENFSNDWIDKLKADMLGQNADVAILVTRTLPKDMLQFGEKSGVYLCNFSEVKSLALILRNAILKISESRKSQENKGEKMIALYNYLTSPEFTGNWNAMREGFGQLKGMLQKEREDFEKNWKRKEKQIELIIQNSLHISGSIEGISGNDAINLQLEEGKSNSGME